MKKKKVLSLMLAAAMTISLAACAGSADSQSTDAGESGSTEEASADAAASEVPAIDQLKVGEDYKDLTADLKILTNRTDLADNVYTEYAAQFHEMYPGITVTYEGITDYEESLTLRLTNGDWGDICFIPTSCDKSEFSTYFMPLGDYDTLNEIYNFVTEKRMTVLYTAYPTAERPEVLPTTSGYGKRPVLPSALPLRTSSWMICS